MTTAFVTGGSSPLGSRLLPELVSAGVEVFALARSEYAASGLSSLGVVVVRGNLIEPDQWANLAAGCETFIHLAGIRFAPQLLEVLSPEQPLIVISSASVANPHHPLSAELREYEQVLAARTASAILRPTMIYGTARDRNLRYLVRLLVRMPRVPVFTGGSRIQPVHVDDVVAAIMQQLSVRRFEVLSLGGPSRVQMHDLVDIISCHLDLPRTRLRVPLTPLARAVTRARLRDLHRAFHAVEMLAYDRTVDLPDQVLLGRPPTPLSEGVRAALVTYGLLPQKSLT